VQSQVWARAGLNAEPLNIGRSNNRMSGDYDKNRRRICWYGLIFFLLALCEGAGCSKGFLGKGPDAGEVWTCDNAADKAMKRLDYETAILLHELLLEKKPANALAFYHLGYAHGQMGDHLKEVSYYEKAVDLGYRKDHIFFNLGMAYAELNDIEKSVKAFRKALEINPNSADNHFELAMAYYQKGIANETAEYEFLTVIKIDPGHVDARFYLSMLYADMGELKKAAEQLHELIEIEPANARARESLERIEKKQQHPGE